MNSRQQIIVDNKIYFIEVTDNSFGHEQAYYEIRILENEALFSSMSIGITGQLFASWTVGEKNIKIREVIEKITPLLVELGIREGEISNSKAHKYLLCGTANMRKEGIVYKEVGNRSLAQFLNDMKNKAEELKSNRRNITGFRPNK